MSSILAVGIAVLDLIHEVAHFPAEDEEMRALARRTALGGNAANTLQVLAQLGHDCELAATLSGDAEGQTLLGMLHAAGIGARHVRIAEGGATPGSCILIHGASRTIVHYRDLEEYGHADFASISLEGFDWLHFEGRNVEETAGMLAGLRPRGFRGRVSLELENPRPGIEALLPHADVAIASRAYVLARGHADATACLTALRRLAPTPWLVCPWGEAGAWALGPAGEALHAPAYPPPSVVDTIGAGDCFNAGLIHALAAGGQIPVALDFACRLAGAKVGRRGFAGLGAWARESQPALFTTPCTSSAGAV